MNGKVLTGESSSLGRLSPFTWSVLSDLCNGVEERTEFIGKKLRVKEKEPVMCNNSHLSFTSASVLLFYMSVVILVSG